MKIPYTLSCFSPPFILNVTTLAMLLVQSVWASDSAGRPFSETPPLEVSGGAEQVAAATQFNSNFLNIGSDQPVADLSMFAYGQQVLPGVYLADVHVNGSLMEQVEIRFDIPSTPAAGAEAQRDPKQPPTALPCLTRAMLTRWGIDLSSVKDLTAEPEGTCFHLPGIIDKSTVNFDVGRQQLHVSVPQVFMRRVARGYVPPEQWDAGVTAGILNYQVNASRNETKSFDSKVTNNVNASVQGGINIGEWRLRHRSNYNRNDGKGSWKALETFAQKDIKGWHSRLTLGDSFTPGEIFDGISIRGVQLNSDESMLPDSLRGYAPVIRGVAQTSATVRINQNGYEIHAMQVAPGPFVIDDLFPTAATGEFEVTIEEADGRKTVFIQPYSALPTQVREGAWRYHVGGGQYRNVSGSKQPIVVQGTAAYGLNSRVTLRGGAEAASLYQSASVGVATGLGNFGVASLDAMHARSKDPADGVKHGQSLRLLYAKSFLPSGTDFRVMSYRYSTQNYRTLTETIKLYDNINWFSQYSRRHRLEGNISQRIGGGSITASAWIEKFWNGDSNRYAQIGYNNSYKKVSYGVSYSYNNSRDLNGISRGVNRTLAMNLSVPLDWNTGQVSPRTAFVSYNANTDLEGRVTQNANVSGLLLPDHSLSYSANVGHSNDTNGTSGGVSMTYRSPYANLTASRSQSRGYTSTSGSVSGGMVVHRGGVTFAQSLGDTVVLVSAPGAKGVAVENHPGVRTDSSGYAVLPYATAYRQNRVALNTEDLGEDVEVKHAAVNVVPTKGAVVLAQYETRQGYKVLLTLRDTHNKPVPFGAHVEDIRGREAGVVGADGQVYLTGLDADGEVVVKWGSAGTTHSCRAKYSLPSRRSTTASPVKTGQTELLMSKASCIE